MNTHGVRGRIQISLTSAAVREPLVGLGNPNCSMVLYRKAAKVIPHEPSERKNASLELGQYLPFDRRRQLSLHWLAGPIDRWEGQLQDVKLAVGKLVAKRG